MSDRDILAELEEMRRLGSIASSEWQSYTWKNELARQRERVIQHLGEALTDAETQHDPHHMLERAIGVSAICMRRLIECRLVTDRFRDSALEVHEISTKADSEWREPFLNRTASELFNNYDLTRRQRATRTPKAISDRLLHARVIAVISTSAYLPDGLLIASDTQSKNQLFHFTLVEITSVFDAFLDDRVQQTFDGFADDGTGQPDLQNVIAVRD